MNVAPIKWLSDVASPNQWGDGKGVDHLMPATTGKVDRRKIVLEPLSDAPAWYFAVKRALDVFIAASLLIFLSPALLLISVLVMMDSPGPALFNQLRMGATRVRTENGMRWRVVPFRIFKFRSMARGSSPLLHRQLAAAYVAEDRGSLAKLTGPTSANATFKLWNDPRLTRMGKLMRKYSIDELPQLWNVLNGSMSLVGPRPVPIYETDNYDAAAWARLAGTPGITGLWQVGGRSTLAFSEMLNLDIVYLRSQSLWLDIKIMLLTIKTVLSRSGTL